MATTLFVLAVLAGARYGRDRSRRVRQPSLSSGRVRRPRRGLAFAATISISVVLLSLGVLALVNVGAPALSAKRPSQRAPVAPTAPAVKPVDASVEDRRAKR